MTRRRRADIANRSGATPARPAVQPSRRQRSWASSTGRASASATSALRFAIQPTTGPRASSNANSASASTAIQCGVDEPAKEPPHDDRARARATPRLCASCSGALSGHSA